MNLMVSLAMQSAPILKRLNEIFEEHVTRDGVDQLEKCSDEALNVSYNLNDKYIMSPIPCLTQLNFENKSIDCIFLI